MEKLGLNELREKFLSFYETKGHLRLPSFSLVPHNDKSLLLINAGMAPLKPYFTGQETPPRKRVTTCQKCIRTPDIESVGKTARHGTYFEMLGNFSFGDYFKHEATSWAWEFCTKVLNMPVDKLWVTIYQDDDEAFDIWTKEVGVAPDRIVRMGKEDNFWEIGQGPCGPCSEIYFDRGEKYGCGSPDCGVGCECDRYVEFWNLVFTQFDKDEDGNYNRLAHPNIDTGMGLERLACIMQDVDNIFEVDTVRNIMKKVIEFAKVEYGKDEQADVSLRVITDHIRSTTFMIADGVKVANDGRGYVLKRLLRRAARHGRLLGIYEPFLYKVCDTVIEENKSAYPYLVEKADYIKKVIEQEEINFGRTVNEGMNILETYVSDLKAKGEKVLGGEQAFKLSDTYGFPIDLTVEILDEKGIGVDREGFDKYVEEQRTRAREARKDADTLGWKDEILEKFMTLPKAEFVGDETNETESKIVGIFSDGDFCDSASDENGDVTIVLDKTPFYGEGGGQVGDTGTIVTDNANLTVIDSKKLRDGRIIHACVIESGYIEKGDVCKCKVDGERRRNIERNHSATHLLQKALKIVLGDHVEQAGSFVNDERLRFDFSHFEAVTQDELAKAEKIVNDEIFAALDITCTEMPIDEAKKLGAMALFGEKYGSVVRVVKMGDFSIELCGGTHLKNTAQCGLFKIISESGVASGVRRIEAVTGRGVIDYINDKNALIERTAAALKTNRLNELDIKAESVMSENKQLEKGIDEFRNKVAMLRTKNMMTGIKHLGEVNILTAQLDGVDANGLKALADSAKSQMQNGVVVLASNDDGKITFVAMAMKEAVEKGVHCGKIIKEVCAICSGRGGGKPDMAQGGGSDVLKIDDALAKVDEMVTEMIKK